ENNHGVLYLAKNLVRFIFQLTSSLLIGAGLALVFKRLVKIKRELEISGKSFLLIINFVFILFSLLSIIAVFYNIFKHSISVELLLFIISFFITYSLEESSACKRISRIKILLALYLL